MWDEQFIRLLDRQRSRRANLTLGLILTFVAGAVNAGGFMAVQRYTSHMTGIISAVADDAILGRTALACAGLAMVGMFIAGAIVTTLLINFARRQRLRGEYAGPVMLEALLLLVFALLGTYLARHSELFVPITVLLLCFIMGLQNAINTKLSQAEIRTTHMTGIVTDLGIELGRALYYNRRPALNSTHYVRANRAKLCVHLALLGTFLCGALAGAATFRAVGYMATLPLAAAMFILAAPALARDLLARPGPPDQPAAR
jgi:uncharacterized membrane protein YoaK (UPF0700 family)